MRSRRATIAALPVLLLVGGCAVEPEEKKQAERLLAVAQQEYQTAKARGDRAGEEALSAATLEGNRVRREADEDARKLRSQSEKERDAILITARQEAESSAERRAGEITGAAQSQAKAMLADAEQRAKQVTESADLAATTLRADARTSANEVVQAIVGAAIAEVYSAAPDDAERRARLGEKVMESTKSVSQALDMVARNLEKEQRSIQQAIETAEKEHGQLSGGLLKNLVAVRKESLMLTLSIVQQRLHAIKANAPIRATVEGTKTDEVGAAALLVEITSTEANLEDARRESAQYSGGLVKTLIEAKIATIDMTLASIRQAYLARKYGLHLPPLHSDSPAGSDLGMTPSTTETQIDASPIKISLIDKGFLPTDVRADRYRDHLTFSFSFTNQLPKDVRAFTGAIVFRDLFDREIIRVSLTLEDGIGAGKSVNWLGGIDYNQFQSEHERLRNTDKKNLKVAFVLDRVIYTDGEKQSFQK